MWNHYKYSHLQSALLDLSKSLAYIAYLYNAYNAGCHPFLYHNKMTPTPIRFLTVVCWGISAVTGFEMIFLELNIHGN